MNLYPDILVITFVVYLRPELPREELLDEELLLTEGAD